MNDDLHILHVNIDGQTKLDGYQQALSPLGSPPNAPGAALPPSPQQQFGTKAFLQSDIIVAGDAAMFIF